MGRKGSEGKKQSLNFPTWMAMAIQDIADKKKCTFTDVVHELLRLELEYMGYSMGIGRQAAHDGAAPAQATEKPARIKKAG